MTTKNCTQSMSNTLRVNRIFHNMLLFAGTAVPKRGK